MSLVVQQLYHKAGNAGADTPVLVRHGPNIIQVESVELAHVPDLAFVIETEQPIIKPVIRRIGRHEVNEANKAIEIAVLDEPGAGGAHHEYRVSVLTKSGVQVTNISFQNGAIKVHGTNGLTQEVLLAIVEDRLECFQNGPFACEENNEALVYVRGAMAVLNKRTWARLKQGVEGLDKQHVTEPVTPAAPPVGNHDAPPVDNAHVAPGCEPFASDPNPVPVATEVVPPAVDPTATPVVEPVPGAVVAKPTDDPQL